jgi:acetylornithine deacetylase
MSVIAHDLLEEHVLEIVREARDEIVGLTGELIRCDTTARDVGDPARDEERLQRLLAAHLASLGADVDVWEPHDTGTGNRFIPDHLEFRGRPQLLARLSGAGAGPTLLLNGHIDAVDVEPREQWSSDPFAPEVREGRLYGRGAADMKGGIAAQLVALESLRRAGVRLAGDVLFSAVTDEESSGAGAWATIEHGLAADAGIVGEPTGFDAWVACRGILKPRITLEGRAGHSQMPQVDWRQGGAVNAIEKQAPVLAAIAELRAEWSTRDDHQHPYLAPGDIVPVLVSGGTWDVTYPASCTLVCDVHYLPGHFHEDFHAEAVKREIMAKITAVAADDTWLAEHPPRFHWEWDVPPAEIPADSPLVRVALGAGSAVGRPGAVGGLNSWHDAAFFTRFGGVPTFSYGGGSLMTAHAVDECVPVDDLVDHCGAVALTTMRYCGVA